jgi:hypothetical protein
MTSILSSMLAVIRDFAPAFTALGLIVAVWTLRANHEWNRRNYTVGLITAWNEKTSSHRKVIERLRPGLIDLNTKGAVTELTKGDAMAIYTSQIDTPEWELRFHFIELLNHFEAVAVAYRNRVGDSRMIDQSLRSALLRWHDILEHFMEVVSQHRGYEPWEPYTAVVAYWKRRPLKRRLPTA